MSPPNRREYFSTDVLVAAETPADLLYSEPSLKITRPALRTRAALRPHFAVICVLFLAVVALQITAGAYHGERDNYSDEAAHFMNGLLVRDYLRDGLGQHPIKFAEEYYLNYPKIAPGMWPPLFDAILGVVALPGWPPFGAALVLLACVTTWTAWRLYRIVIAGGSRLSAALVASLFVFTPIVVDMTSAVMLDIVVAAFALEATYWLAQFFRSENWRHAALFGIFSACCCLTKGNGVSMVLVPLLLMLFTGQYRLLRHPGLYIAACIVVVFAVPPLAISYRLDSVIGDFAPVGVGGAIARLNFYAAYLWGQLGTLPLVLSLIGFIRVVRRPRGENPESLGFGSAMCALAAAALIFHAANPHQVIAGRYLTLAVAPFLALAAVGIETLSALIQPPEWRRASQAVLVAAVVIFFFAGRPAVASRAPQGFRATVEFLEARGLAGRRVLIVSDEDGEGALVSEVAIRHPNPPSTIIRGSKLVASDDWAGHNFKMLFSSSKDLMRELEDLHVDYLVVDTSLNEAAVPYRGQIDEMIAIQHDRLERVSTINEGRSIATYRLKYRSPGSAKTLRIALTNSLGRTLER
jgi:hypothetical protein